MLIKYIQTHPIPYQSPFIRYLTKNKIKIKVLYRSNISTTKFYDQDFQKRIKWDTELLKNIDYKYLNYIGPNKVTSIFPITTNFIEKIFDNNTKIIWVHGIKNWYNLIIIFLAKFFGKKVFIRDEVHKNSKKRSLLNNLFNFFFYRFIDNFIDIYLSIGTANKNYYLKKNIDKKKIILVPYVVDNNFFYKTKKIQKNKKLTYLFAAKFRKRKGPDLLLRSINLLKKNKTFTSNVKFVFVGEGYMKKELKEYTKQKGLKNVSFLPFQNQKRLKKIYQKSDIFVMPSREEPWGLALNEAMASENVIISSNLVGSSFDLVKNGMNGYKFKNGDYKDLANKMLKVYHQKKRLTQFKLNSKRIISKWDFKMCLTGIKKAIRTITI